MINSSASPIYQFDVSKQSILDVNTQVINRITELAKEQLRQQRSIDPLSFNLSISGFDADPRGLFEISEIRTWCRNVHTKAPFLLCLLSELTLYWFMLCLLDIEVKQHQNHTLNQEFQSKLESILGSSEKAGQMDSQTIEQIRESIFHSYREAGQTDSQTIEQIFESVKWTAELNYDSNDLKRIIDETLVAGLDFFMQCNVDETIAEKLVNEASQRLARRGNRNWNDIMMKKQSEDTNNPTLK